MSDPWKRQLIWQQVIEKETLHYASLAEKAPQSIAIQTEQSSQPQEYHKAEPVYETPKLDPYVQFAQRLPSLPISSSSTGSLHYMYAKHRSRAHQLDESDSQIKEYRHGQNKHFVRRNVRGGFFTS